MSDATGSGAGLDADGPRTSRSDSTGPTDELADLLDAAIARVGEAREAFLRDLAERRPSEAREVRELLARLPDPEIVESAPRAEFDVDGFAGEPAIGETIGGVTLSDVAAPDALASRKASRSRAKAFASRASSKNATRDEPNEAERATLSSSNRSGEEASG